ncbi:universal stress protein [Streptomyces roseolus]|nr:universal stress protein [Streptomyces roseolus]
METVWLPLVAGVDGSASGLRAVDWAVAEASRLALPVKIVHATMEEDRGASRGPGTGTAIAPGHDVGRYLVQVARERARLRDPDVKVSTELLCGDAVAALLHAGRNASALVIGARGHGELKDLLLGSVSLGVAARAQCPVVVVRDGDKPPADRYGRILLGVADATSGSEAVRFAFELAAARGCVLDAMVAWEHPPRTSISRLLGLPYRDDRGGRRARAVLDEALERSAGEFPSVDVHRVVIEGPARDVLLKHSEATDLLVVGARRRLNHAGLHLGRVNHALLHYAGCSVAVVPQWRGPPE